MTLVPGLDELLWLLSVLVFGGARNAFMSCEGEYSSNFSSCVILISSFSRSSMQLSS